MIISFPYTMPEREGKEMKFVVETCKKVSVEIHQQY